MQIRAPGSSIETIRTTAAKNFLEGDITGCYRECPFTPTPAVSLAKIAAIARPRA